MKPPVGMVLGLGLVERSSRWQCLNLEGLCSSIGVIALAVPGATTTRYVTPNVYVMGGLCHCCSFRYEKIVGFSSAKETSWCLTGLSQVGEGFDENAKRLYRNGGAMYSRYVLPCKPARKKSL